MKRGKFMMKITINKDEICPCAVTLALLSSKWKILIIRELLLSKSQRYNSLKKKIAGISQKMLTQSLKEMERDGLVSRKVYPEIPPHVEYKLTKLGESLEPVIMSLNEWGKNFIHDSDLAYLNERFDLSLPQNKWLKTIDE